MSYFPKENGHAIYKGICMKKNQIISTPYMYGVKMIPIFFHIYCKKNFGEIQLQKLEIGLCCKLGDFVSWPAQLTKKCIF